MGDMQEGEEQERKKIREHAISELEQLIRDIEEHKFEGYFLIARNQQEPYDCIMFPSVQALRRAEFYVVTMREVIESEHESNKSYV